MFNTKEVKTTTGNYISKYLNPGQHLVKINKITIKEATSGNKQLHFEVETEPVTTEGFTPAEGYHGQVGTVKTVYIASPEMEQQVATMISILADEMGVREQVDAIQSSNLEDYVTELSKLVCTGEYVWMTINGKEYINGTTGKVGMELQFPRYKMFASKTKLETVGAEKALTKTYTKTLPAQEASTKSETDIWSNS